jgi:predicted permease
MSLAAASVTGKARATAAVASRPGGPVGGRHPGRLSPRRRRANPDRRPTWSGDESIAVIVDIVAPIFGIVLVGYLAARLRAFDEAATRGLSLFAFNFAIPVMLVRTLARAELPAQPEWGLLLAYFGGALLVFATAALAARRLFRRRGADPAIFGISAAFSNIVILGIPLVLEAFGPSAAVPLSLVVAVHSAFLFTVTTIVAEVGAGAGAPLRELPANVGKGLVGNPILWGIAGGLALNLAGLALPAVLDRLASILGGAALPAALFALGANLSRFHLAGSLREALLLTALKILVQPALVWLLAVWLFPLQPVSLAVAVTIAALPSGINAYLFAVRYQAGVPEASSTILVSTLISVVTLSLLLATLRG